MTTDTRNTTKAEPRSNHEQGSGDAQGERNKEIRLNHVDTSAGSLEQDRSEEKRNLIWRKRANTIFVGVSFTCLGLVFSMFGPSMLDLNNIINVDIEGGAILFTSTSIGYLAGCLICGIVIEKFNQDILMFCFTFTMGAIFMFIPWAKVKAAMAVLVAFGAFNAGATDTAGNAICMQIWGIQVGPYMQAIYFLYSVGGLVGPFIVEPFLMDMTNTTTSLCYGNYSQCINNSNTSIGNIQLDDIDQQPETRLYIAFLIGGFITVASSFPFIYMYFKNKGHGNWNTESQQEEDGEREVTLALSGKIVYLVLLSMFFLVYMSMEDSFIIFLPAFVVEYAGMTRSDGANIMSVYWGTFAVSRLLAVLIAKILTPWKMIMLDFIILLITFLLLCFLAHIPAFLWAASALAALGLASLIGASFAWIEIKIMKVNGHIASILLISGCIGNIISPLVIGHLFETYTPMWFVWLPTGQCILLILIFSGITVLTKIQFGQVPTGKEIEFDVDERILWLPSTDV